ncbi:MAG: methyl-accepting chemotaxis protein [Pseudomonadales bacterium]|nr:methyl-accepting chemotaxis protein [Pseudomonadales bacterium]
MNKFLSNLTISRRIAWGYSLMILLICIVAGMGVSGALRLEANLQFILGPAWQAADGTMMTIIGIQRQNLLLERAMNTSAMSMSSKLPGDLEDALDYTDEHLADLRQSGLFDDGTLASLDDLLEAFAEAQAVLVKQIRASHQPTRDNRTDYERATQALISFLDQIEETGDALVEDQIQASNATVTGAIAGITIVLGIAVLAALGFAVLSNRSIARPVREAAERLKQIAHGEANLAQALVIDSHDELGELATHFNYFVSKLRATLDSLHESADQIGASSTAMSSVSNHSSANLARQQADLESLASATNEMAATVQNVAENAASTSQLAKESNQYAHRGTTIVRDVMTTMESLAGEVESASQVISQLAKESNRIGSVLEVISDIAEQTNLLALNATIESARAGEHGRGFAVVADEVRTLAGRTHEATQEIREMIESLQSGAGNAVQAMDNSRDKAQQAVKQVSNAESALEDIARSSDSINDMNQSIADAAREQFIVAEELNRNVHALNDLAHETAEGSRDIANASVQLAQLSVDLRTTVAAFQA